MKKVLTFIVCTIMFFSFKVVSASAETNKKSIVDELQALNDEGWNEFLDGVDVNSENAFKDEVYLKIYQLYDQTYVDEESYDASEYLMESMSITPRLANAVTSWLKITMEVYPSYIDSTKSSVLGSYEWLTSPIFQAMDVFTISSDTNYVIPGSNLRVNASYWPNISCPQVVGSYNNFSNPSKFEFDSQGVSFKNNISNSDLDTEIRSQSNLYDYFYGAPSGWATRGNPKGVLGFTLSRSNTTTINGNLTFTYNHQQVTLNYTPSVTVDNAGNVSIKGGITAGLGYDKASTTVTYKWGTPIQ